MTREEVEEVMRPSEPIQASFEVIGDDVKFIKLIVNGKENIVSVEELENTLSEPCDCISREEVCDYIAEFVNHEYATDRERELVKNIIDGIQHLPSIQPTTKENLVVEDCISRKAVLDALNKWDWQELYLPVHFKDIIDDLPSIQPKTKTAYWQNNACSNCGIYNASAYKNWCPNCGCKMEEEKKADKEQNYMRGYKDGKSDVLDKIRAEIKEESRFCPLTEGLERALEIIDKYTAEKE